MIRPLASISTYTYNKGSCVVKVNHPMSEKIIAVLPVMVKKDLQSRLPPWIEARWFATKEQALDAVPGAQIGWLDMQSKPDMAQAVTAASGLRWLNSLYAGIDGIPLDLLKERGVIFTNGAGINAITIAEYVVMGMLALAKGYREVIHAQHRHEWLAHAPGTQELSGSKALILGYGAIGQLVEERLKAFQVDVTVVRRSEDGSGKCLRPDQWRDKLGEFDWVILAVPATAETEHMIASTELKLMKNSAVLLNVARGSVVDQEALVAALQAKEIRAAFLDVTTPEPLPVDHILWSLDNAHITMHLSGRSQSQMVPRSNLRFLENLERYRTGRALKHQVNLIHGY
jgi:phosphoglycerate dehydrogenase-like enzyme